LAFLALAAALESLFLALFLDEPDLSAALAAPFDLPVSVCSPLFSEASTDAVADLAAAVESVAPDLPVFADFAAVLSVADRSEPAWADSPGAWLAVLLPALVADLLTEALVAREDVPAFFEAALAGVAVSDELAAPADLALTFLAAAVLLAFLAVDFLVAVLESVADFVAAVSVAALPEVDALVAADFFEAVLLAVAFLAPVGLAFLAAGA